MVKLYKGKVLLVTDEYLIIARGYHLYKYQFATNYWSSYAKIEDYRYAFLAKFKLTRRLLRAEITAMYKYNGVDFCIAKKGIFRRKGNVFKKCFNISRGSRPLNLCFDNDSGNIYFGEYFANMQKDKVCIFCSNDMGENWHVVYTFPCGEINHIHGIFKDLFTHKLWVVTGDRENECIIANTDNGFETLNIVFRGGQEFRSCNLMFYEKFIVFVTDSQYIENEIKCFDRNTRCIEVLNKVQGSVIKGGQIGCFSFFSTTIEPSQINIDNNSYVWISHDGKRWKQVFFAEKDYLPVLFQMGIIEFPTYMTKKEIQMFYFTGKALKEIDNQICEIKL